MSAEQPKTAAVVHRQGVYAWRGVALFCVVAKASGWIDWPWLWVLAPIWIVLVLVALGLVGLWIGTALLAIIPDGSVKDG